MSNLAKMKEVNVCRRKSHLPTFQSKTPDRIDLVYGPAPDQQITLSIIEAELIAEQVLQAIADCSARRE